MSDFEGSLVLEKLAAMELVEDFLEAVDSDDTHRVISLLRQADVDDETISTVLKEIRET